VGESVRVKECVTCGEHFLQSNNRKKAASYCAECYRQYHRDWREDQKATDPLFNIRKNAWEKHGLYAEELEAWVVEVGNCPCCGVEFDRGNRAAMPCVDHDHECCPPARSCHKCRRGLLCFNCNTVLGKVKDSPETLRALITYLERATNV
jgi:hypothetical protein